MAQELAQNLSRHRDIGLAHYGIADLPFDRWEIASTSDRMSSLFPQIVLTTFWNVLLCLAWAARCGLITPYLPTASTF